MRVVHGFLALLGALVVVGSTSAQSIEQTQFIFRRSVIRPDSCDAPASGPVTLVPLDPKGKQDPLGVEPKDRQDQPPMVDPQAFAQAPAAGGEGGMSFNPAMFGDLGVSGSYRVIIPGSTTVIPGTTTIVLVPTPPSGTLVPQPVTTPSTVISTPSRVISVPIVGHAAFKIADNESPRPTDRVFFTYNYYNAVQSPDTSFNLHREMMGFEKTFLDGNASFGMRLPFQQISDFTGPVGITNNAIGDLTMILKYAVINDRDTGSVLSGGLALTAPTSQETVFLPDGSQLRSVLFQPYLGWITNRGAFFAQGFHSVVVPSSGQDVTSLNNDVGIGYWMYRGPDRVVRAIVPTIEGHLFTPLNHRNNTEPISAFDIFTVTTGVNFVLARNSTLGVAVAVPVTGPTPNRVEAIVSFNYRF
jgi:hypothetical protein